MREDLPQRPPWTCAILTAVSQGSPSLLTALTVGVITVGP